MLYQLWSIAGVIGAITEICTQRILSVATKVTQCQIWPIANLTRIGAMVGARHLITTNFAQIPQVVEE